MHSDKKGRVRDGLDKRKRLLRIGCIRSDNV